jgi:hypothetical protein
LAAKGVEAPIYAIHVPTGRDFVVKTFNIIVIDQDLYNKYNLCWMLCHRSYRCFIANICTVERVSMG